MGDFRTHNCAIAFNGEQIPVASPMSQLDCDNPECQRQAEIARRGCGFGLKRIERRLQEAREHLAGAREQVELWELVLEAKLREEN
ncbi:hypothetical protein SEA_EJIMIX_111 [Mycobacterium phage Ejimix]|uniref:hypothetical protein n=1 Tax=Mycobacterium phage Redno2 TaxID=1340709 RepID=UPI000387AB65|nr:hypothetical protein N860_gp109 [Mycobacterium phage Redno2]AGS82408.1 hypothetical protein PBI_REDNO2_109 [Mycobacterium phage Redno2]AWH13930.1 hypothetical protein SEA_HALLEY_119 [Mycobacterium phage Halley]AXQ52112.1 hypothetical protein SEA_EJIMIX_111 [Mycobacterium phage Ejimix]QBI97560.1 hypothetical protein SEA_HUGHESYANG_116 [Mycobacterium phage Hughesyang]